MAISESDSISAYGAAWRAIPTSCPFSERLLDGSAAGDRLAVPLAHPWPIADDALAATAAERVALDVPLSTAVLLAGRGDIALLRDRDGVLRQRGHPAEHRDERDHEHEARCGSHLDFPHVNLYAEEGPLS